MAAVASVVVEYGNVATPITVPNVHLKYDDDNMEIAAVASAIVEYGNGCSCFCYCRVWEWLQLLLLL